MMQFLLITLCLLITLPILLIGLLISYAIFLLGKCTGNDLLKKFGRNVAISIDQIANVLLLGDCEETISSRTGRAITSGKAKWWVIHFANLVDFLAFHLFGDKNHCASNIDEGLVLNYELWSWIKS